METITLNGSGGGEVAFPIPAPGRFMFWWHLPGGVLATSAALGLSLEVGGVEPVPVCSVAGGGALVVDLTAVATGSFEFTGGGSAVTVAVVSDAANSGESVNCGVTRLPN